MNTQFSVGDLVLIQNAYTYGSIIGIYMFFDEEYELHVFCINNKGKLMMRGYHIDRRTIKVLSEFSNAVVV